MESWAVVLCLRCGACATCILALGHSPAAAWLFTAAAYLLRCCCCDDHGRLREEVPSPSDWNTLPSEPSDPSHCLLERSTRSAGCRVANSITENTIDLKHSDFLISFTHFLRSRKRCVNGSSTKIQGAQKPRFLKMEEIRFKVVHVCTWCNFRLSIQSYSSVVPSNLIVRIQFLQSHCYNTLHIHPNSSNMYTLVNRPTFATPP